MIPVIGRSAVPFALLALTIACAGTEPHSYLHEEEKPRAAEWGYEGEIGPEHWGDLSPDYALAKTGRQQSPIDIHDATAADLPALQFDYGTESIDLVYNGHTIEEKAGQPSSIEVDGRTYELQQFHFHSPSEHTLDGDHAAMEMHLVHKADDGHLAVVAVMIREGAENAAFAPVWDYLPTDTNRERATKATVDVAALLPEDRRYYRYMGSFTTPPCTEGVLWLVMHSPIQLSSSQIAKFRDVIEGNNRPVQPLNGREISVSR